ncbi:MAG: hypothetical protein LWW85_10555 [Marinilabiliales bacterium]|nr:hypothetical protein [Marinilabiliales bacterium]
MRIFYTILIMWLLSPTLLAQDGKRQLEGTVSYLTAQNVYVKFAYAKGIKPGDELFILQEKKLVPVMRVENVSTVSCVGKPLGDTKLKTGDRVIALVSKEQAIAEPIPSPSHAAKTPSDSTSTSGKMAVSSALHQERVVGRVQIASYTNLANTTTGNNTRMRYTGSIQAENIQNSPVSFDAYLSFSHLLNDWSPIQSNLFNGLKIYDLNLRYQAGSKNTISLGRRINPRISNLGAMDGLQYERNLKHFYWGTVVGFRPDYTDYGFNKKLLEYGGFIGHSTSNANGQMQTSLAAFNQTNGGKTDRRYLYFQHDNSLAKHLNFYCSSEVDLYKLVNGLPVNQLTLTSLYLMLHYRFSGKLSLSTSYDNRKNIIYYETYKNYIDLMLADATRQGVQFRINYRPWTKVFTNFSASYWDQSNDSKPTTNFNGYLSFSQLPFLQATLSLNANHLQTSYVKGNIYGLRIDKELLNGKLFWSLDYRYVDYLYPVTSQKLLEQIGETDFSLRISRKLSFSINWQGTFEKTETYHQIYCSFIQRF